MKMEAPQQTNFLEEGDINERVAEALAAPSISINTKCPFCNKEVEEDDDVGMGNEDDITKMDVEAGGTFQLFHVKCYQNK